MYCGLHFQSLVHYSMCTLFTYQRSTTIAIFWKYIHVATLLNFDLGKNEKNYVIKFVQNSINCRKCGSHFRVELTQISVIWLQIGTVYFRNKRIPFWPSFMNFQCFRENLSLFKYVWKIYIFESLEALMIVLSLLKELKSYYRIKKTKSLSPFSFC
jgi:hypothetical protein